MTEEELKKRIAEVASLQSAVEIYDKVQLKKLMENLDIHIQNTPVKNIAAYDLKLLDIYNRARRRLESSMINGE